MLKAVKREKLSSRSRSRHGHVDVISKSFRAELSSFQYICSLIIVDKLSDSSVSDSLVVVISC